MLSDFTSALPTLGGLTKTVGLCAFIPPNKYYKFVVLNEFTEVQEVAPKIGPALDGLTILATAVDVPAHADSSS